MDKANEALKLWQEWFEKGGNPWHYFDPQCFFCEGYQPDHKAGCIYIQAQTLVEGLLDESK